MNRDAQTGCQEANSSKPLQTEEISIADSPPARWYTYIRPGDLRGLRRVCNHLIFKNLQVSIVF